MPTKEHVLDILRNVYDPEIMINIVDLGLVYNIDVKDKTVLIDLTLTSPACPVGDLIENEAISWVKQLEDVSDVKIKFIWDPPWAPEKMSDEAKLELGYEI